MATEMVPVPVSAPLAKVDQNPVACYLASLSPGSRPTIAKALAKVSSILNGSDYRTFPWHELRHQHTAFVRAELTKLPKVVVANLYLSALRGVLKEAWRLGLLDGNSYQSAIDVPSIKGSSLPSGRSLEAGELRALFAVCADDETPAGPRDAAVLACLYGGGLRRSEVADLDTADYNAATGELKVRSGKGNKDRLAYATNGAKAALDAWLAIRGTAAGPLFVPINKGGNIGTNRMTDQAIYYILRKRGEEAGVDKFSPHDLRRSFISDLLDAGGDVSNIQRLAGHANVSTTLRYDRRPEHAKRKTAELLHVPFGGFRICKKRAE